MAQTPFPLADAQVHATLAAIAYAGDMLHDAEPSLDQLYNAISVQIHARPHYATGHDWHLSWGPIEARRFDNLIFAAYSAPSQTLAIVIRGTTTQTWSRFEDVPWSQTLSPPGNANGAAVSSQFLEGLKSVLSLADKWHGQTLAQFVTAFCAANTVRRVTVCGHSQGAALTPMMMLALQDGLYGAPKVTQPVSGFAIAPPTSGNPEFAALADAQLDCWYVINPLDVVPLGYNRMKDVYEKGIPEPLNIFEKPGIEAAIAGLDLIVDHAGHWAQPSRQATLEAIHDTSDGFFGQIGAQHNHNTYLHLMGAVQTDVGDPSPFPQLQTPKITT